MLSRENSRSTRMPDRRGTPPPSLISQARQNNTLYASTPPTRLSTQKALCFRYLRAAFKYHLRVWAALGRPARPSATRN